MVSKPRITLEWLYSKQGLETFQRYITAIRRGSYGRVAAAQIGVAPSTLVNWLQKGKKEFEDEEETYHAQFYSDTVEAIAEARATAEGMVMEDNPLMWLKKGPGRFLGDDWSDNPQTDSDGNRIEFEVDGTQTIKIEKKDEDTSSQDNHADILQTLIELKKANISLDQLVDMIMAGDYDLDQGLGPLIEQQQLNNITKHIEGE